MVVSAPQPKLSFHPRYMVAGSVCTTIAVSCVPGFETRSVNTAAKQRGASRLSWGARVEVAPRRREHSMFLLSVIRRPERMKECCHTHQFSCAEQPPSKRPRKSARAEVLIVPHERHQNQRSPENHYAPVGREHSHRPRKRQESCATDRYRHPNCTGRQHQGNK